MSESAGTPEPLDLGQARQAAFRLLDAYRHRDDPNLVLAALAETSRATPPHWLLTGLLSVANELLAYLARAQDVTETDLLSAMLALEQAARAIDTPSTANEAHVDEASDDEESDDGEPGAARP